MPEDGNCDASVNVILVAESVIPEARVVDVAPTSSPPQDPRDQPNPCAFTSGPM